MLHICSVKRSGGGGGGLGSVLQQMHKKPKISTLVCVGWEVDIVLCVIPYSRRSLNLTGTSLKEMRE